MRQVVIAVLLVGCVAPQATALQAQGGAAGKISACSLLTRDLVTKTTPYSKQALDAVLQVRPIEDAVGPSGSSCSYGGVTLQIDPFRPDVLDKQRTKAWVSVPGVGQSAYFVDKGGEYGELYVRTGARVLTIQMDVPMGRTAASIQPNVVALAQALLPTLN